LKFIRIFPFQWLDCVYQVMVQHPDEFEFSTDLLLFIATHVVVEELRRSAAAKLGVRRLQ
jgi:hypothetical protein